ncbi:hypothetical protein AMJ49_02045 [Parcubacteria bacterium DG_74_2]|nr:MAG: hypothetical protein AMJ49_02045 [Parcubacteria bacterium DG_74_2]
MGQSQKNLNEEDPPDSLLTERRNLIKESFEKQGSFFLKTEIKIISDINQCFELWQEFSPKNNLFDTWEFRFAFYEGYKYKPYFLLLKNEKENLALLPLWYDFNKKRYFWFGSYWQEEVSFFAKESDFILTLLSAAPSPLLLNAICEDSIKSLKDEINFEEDDPKYILNLKGFKNHEDYLMTLRKNTRHDLRKDRRKIEKQNPEIIFNNFSDFERMVNLAKKRFQEKGEESDWEDPKRIEAFKQVIKLSGRSYKVRMITVKIDGRTAGVDLICLFNNSYFTVKCGYDVKNFPGIGNFINLFEIDDAIRLGMKRIDFLQNNYEWKERYFQGVSLFKYEKF